MLAMYWWLDWYVHVGSLEVAPHTWPQWSMSMATFVLNAGISLCSVCRLSYVNSLPDHEGPVTAVATSPTLGDIATVCSRKSHKYTSECVRCNYIQGSYIAVHVYTSYMYMCAQTLSLYYRVHVCYIITYTLVIYSPFVTLCRIIIRWSLCASNVDHQWKAGGQNNE